MAIYIIRKCSLQPCMLSDCCLTLYQIQTRSDASAVDDLEHVEAKWAISPFALMFSTLSNKYISLYRYFPHFSLDVFKFDCCRLVVCVKGLKGCIAA